MSQVISSVCNYIFLTVITTIGTESYGLWAMVLLVAGYVTPWASLGLESALAKFLPTYKCDKDKFKAYWFARKTSFAFCILIAFVLLVFSKQVSQYAFGNPRSWILVFLVCIIFLLESQLIIGFAVIRAKENMHLFSFLGIIRSLADLLFIGGLSLLLPVVEYLLIIRIIVLCFMNLIQHFFIKKMHRSDGESLVEFPKEGVGFLRFGFPTVPANSIWFLIAGADRFMLSYYGNISDVGIYNLADTLALSANNLSKPINAVIKPRLANVIHNQPSESAYYINKSIKFLLIFLSPICLSLCLFSRDIIDLIFAEDFIRASTVLPMLSIAHLAIAIVAPLSTMVLLQRGGKPLFYVLAICLTVNISLNLVLIPHWGIIGAAFATLMSHLLYIVIMYLISDSVIRKEVQSMFKLLFQVMAGLVFMAIPYIVLSKLHISTNLLFILPLCFFVYFMYLWNRRIFTESEVKSIIIPINFIKNFTSK